MNFRCWARLPAAGRVVSAFSIMEILNLDDLAKDQAYEFFFVLGPLLFRGGIGVPITAAFAGTVAG